MAEFAILGREVLVRDVGWRDKEAVQKIGGLGLLGLLGVLREGLIIPEKAENAGFSALASSIYLR